MKQNSYLTVETNKSETICRKCGEMHPRCTGHRKRKNTGGVWVMCMNWPLRSSTTKKCKHCGGASLKGSDLPQYKDGKRSKYEFLPSQVAGRIRELSGNAIDNLEESLNIQAALETRILERYGSGESTHAWSKLRRAVAKYKAADRLPEDKKDSARARAFETIAMCVEEGLRERSIVRDIQSIHESQRKLTDTLVKCRKEIQETYTREVWDQMMGIVIRIVRNNVKDRIALTGIHNDFIIASGIPDSATAREQLHAASECD